MTTKWAVHVIGPDDILVAESHDAAANEAAKLNDFFERRRAADPHPYEPILRAEVIPYPGTAEQHAAAMRRYTQTAIWDPRPDAANYFEMRRSEYVRFRAYGNLFWGGLLQRSAAELMSMFPPGSAIWLGAAMDQRRGYQMMEDAQTVLAATA